MGSLMSHVACGVARRLIHVKGFFFRLNAKHTYIHVSACAVSACMQTQAGVSFLVKRRGQKMSVVNVN